MISVGIIGSSGYLGKNLINFCNQHVSVDNFEIYGNTTADNYLHEIFPEFQYITENKKILSLENISLSHDIYFLALPHGQAIKLVPELINAGNKVIDLSGDFRFDSPDDYLKWYNLNHSASYLLKEKLYGLADLPSSDYENVKLIANPGCYPTASLLALLPLVKNHNEIISSISIVSYSGVSGAGKTPRQDLMLAEMDGNVVAYNIHKHRHEAEIYQELYKIGFKGDFSFTTHLLPISTGIYATSNIFLKEEINAEELNHIYSEFYSSSQFVRLRNTPPQLKWVVGTNFCDINLSVRTSSVIITSAIDNLIKGGAGQAIQNMNKVFGLDESTGLINSRSKNVSVN